MVGWRRRHSTEKETGKAMNNSQRKARSQRVKFFVFVYEYSRDEYITPAVARQK